MNIKVSDLKKFSTLSSHIKSSGILPIHNYIKFGGGKIQKQVTGSFIIFDCVEANEELLVEEQKLYALVRVTSAPTISITKKQNKSVISDGKDTFSPQSAEAVLFKDLSTSQEGKKDLSPAFSEAIGAAAQLCQNMGIIPDKYMYVMIGNKSVCGISQMYGYYRPIEEAVQMVLEKKVASFLSKAGILSFSETESHYFFYTPEATLGFAKQEMGYGKFAKMFEENPGELTFISSNADIKSYNSLAIELCENPTVTMTTKGVLEMYDMSTDLPHVRPLDSIKPYEDFSYNPVYMNLVLSALYTEELSFYQKKDMLLIKDNDTNAVAVIGKLNKI